LNIIKKNGAEPNADNLSDRIVITKLKSQHIIDLTKNSYFQGSDVLNQGLSAHLLKTIKLHPSATKLVAFDKEEKMAVGFLCLEENTKKLSSIKFVFVHPNYRKMGIAKRLLNQAFALAKEKGAKKINLNVYPTSTNAINLYKKLGFAEVGESLFAQGSVLGVGPSRFVRRAAFAQGCLTKLTLDKKSQLLEIDTSSKLNRETLYGIYQRCAGQVWIDFFEINQSNLINGSRHLWQPPYFRSVLINNSFDSFALVFTQPMSGKASVEVYSNKAAIYSFLSDLLKVLANRGVGYSQITLPGFQDSLSSWFKEKEMSTIHFVAMGKIL
jgi:GNAT superfamily N-acetyltransferase